MEQSAIAVDLAAEVGGACLGMRVARLHRVVTRCYEQALQTVGLSQPQMEVLTCLVIDPKPVRPATLATQLMLERSTVSRNLALMQKNGWIAAVETSATGRAMSVTITEAGVAAFARAGSAWRRAQADAVKMLGPDAVTTLNQWLGLNTPSPASESDVDAVGPRSRASAGKDG
ncbi:MarR family winged helix-turn-helix transcriptional regulator [Streptomyces sp. NPDC054933]